MNLVSKSLGPKYTEVCALKYIPDNDSLKWKMFIKDVLIQRFLYNSVYIIFWSGNINNKITYDILSPYRLGEKDANVFFINKVSEDIITFLVNSYEFELGNITLASGSHLNQSDFKKASMVNYITDNDIINSDVAFEMITCVNDGKCLSWFNYDFLSTELLSIYSNYNVKFI